MLFTLQQTIEDTEYQIKKIEKLLLNSNVAGLRTEKRESAKIIIVFRNTNAMTLKLSAFLFIQLYF